jgi:hypothetical protein
MNIMMTVLRRSLALLLLVVSGLSTSGRAETFGEFTYTINGVSATITGYTGPGGNVTIPDAIGDKPVVNIGDSAFINSTNLMEITIPNSVTNIGILAFKGCTGLTNVTVGTNVRIIGSGAFTSCSNLATINIPNGVDAIRSAAFSYCSSLMSLTIPDGIKAIEGLTFYKCTSLTNVAIPNGVNNIEGRAFDGCASLTNIEIPDSVTNIDSSTFEGCYNLKNLRIPNNVTTIGFGAFMYCQNLTDVVIGSSVAYIGPSAFSDCYSLTNAIIGTNVTTIEAGAFHDCRQLASVYFEGDAPTRAPDGIFFGNHIVVIYHRPGTTGWGSTFAGCPVVLWGDPPVRIEFLYLTNDFSVVLTAYNGFGGNVTIPDAVGEKPVTSIGAYAFYRYPGVTSVFIPSSVTNIGPCALSGCIDLTAITVDPLNSSFASLDGILFNKTKTSLRQYPAGRVGDYSIPAGVTCIGYGAFDGATNLTSVTIPDGVTTIEERSFTGCTSLTGVYFQGNAPASAPTNLFFSATNVTVYYRADTTGWTDTFAGRPTALWIESSPITDFTYTTNDSSAVITGYTGPGGNVTIPDIIGGIPVTTIGDSAFYRCLSLTNITIPASVINLGEEAFYGCRSLTEITIPNSVINLGSETFAHCYALTNATLSNNITNIVDMMFVSCTNLAKITIPGSVTSIGKSAFQNCPQLAAITIPNSVTNLGNSAFNGCRCLTEVIIPDRVKSLGASMFFKCLALTNVILPTNITNIMDWTFSGCSSLANVALPETVTSIGNYAFSNCTNLTEITIPDSVTNIGTGAFRCTSLTSITIPDSVTSIGDYAFSECNYLSGVTIPAGVTYIGTFSFNVCANLTAITVDPINAKYSSVDGVLFNKSQTILIKYPEAKDGDYVVPKGVTNIDNSAFYLCTKTTNITIPDGVISIGERAFGRAVNLAYVNIPKSVTQISEFAFYGCANLTHIALPASVISLGADALARCSSLKAITVDEANKTYSSIDGVLFNKSQDTLLQCPGGITGGYMIPATVTLIRTTAFSGCAGLTDFSVPADSAYSVIDGVLFNKDQNTLILCPEGRTGSFTIPDSVTKMEAYAFAGCAGLTNISIPNTIDTISTNAFYNCTGLTNIVIPSSVHRLCDSAFMGCTGLVSVIIPSSVNWMEILLFGDCTNLTSVFFEGDAPKSDSSFFFTMFFNANQVTVYYRAGTKGWGSTFGGQPTALWVEQPQNIDFTYTTNATSATITKYIGNGGNVTIPDAIGGKQVVAIEDSAFMFCRVLTGIIIPDGVHSIGYSAFFMCSNLTSLVIGNGVTNIVGSAFASCSNLASVDIPNSVLKVGTYAFSDCTALTNLTISTGVSSIDEKAFVGCTKLTAIEVDTQNANYSSNDGVLFDKSQSTLIQCPAGRIGNYVIPDTVSTIGISAFDSCWGLTNVTVPSSVTSIGDTAFWKCTSLTGVYFQGNPPAVVPKYVFYLATNVTVYYRAGTTGWGPTFGGRPTALWVEQPTYQEWAQRVGLLDKFPDASAETDDADHDGMTNLAEMQAGTDPTTPNSKLAFESAARINDLADGDKTAVGPGQHALYFQTVPGKKYELQSATAIAGVWQTETNIAATTTQKRVLVSKPVNQGFYRLILVP